MACSLSSYKLATQEETRLIDLTRYFLGDLSVFIVSTRSLA